MRVRIKTVPGDQFRPGEVLNLPDETARSFVLAGYAVELPAGDIGATGDAHGSDILMPEGRPGEADPRPPAGQ